MTISKPLALVLPLVTFKVGVPLPAVGIASEIGSLATGFPLPSTTAIVTIEVPFRFTAFGEGLTLIVAAAAGVKLTWALPFMPPVLAVMVAVRMSVPAVSVAWASPFASV